MSHTSLTQGNATTQYTYDANNRLTYEDNGTAAKAYSYDPNGNRILEKQTKGRFSRLNGAIKHDEKTAMTSGHTEFMNVLC